MVVESRDQPPRQTPIPGIHLGTPMAQRTTLPLHLLEPDPLQPRSDAGDEALSSDLELSVKEVGIMQEIRVEGPNSNGKYRIVYGERRYRAALKAGLEEVPVCICEKLSEQERLELQLAENLHRRDLNIRDRARAFARFVTFFPNQKEAAIRLGISEGRLSELLELNDLKPEVAALAESKVVRDASTLAMLNQLAKRSPEQAAVIIDQATTKGKITRKEVATVLAPHRKPHKPKTSSDKSFDAPRPSETNPPTMIDLSSGVNSPVQQSAPSDDSPSPHHSAQSQQSEHAQSPSLQQTLPGFEDVGNEKLEKVTSSLKISRNAPSRVLIAQLVDAYLDLLNKTEAMA